jgi:uncharacterized phage-associated protein
MKTKDQILKIKAVVLYILKAFPEGVDYIHLFKVMYFAQQNQLKEYGLPIVYDTFVARKHGPVPTLTYKVLRGVEGKTELSSELKDFAASLDVELSVREPKYSPSMSFSNGMEKSIPQST